MFLPLSVYNVCSYQCMHHVCSYLLVCVQCMSLSPFVCIMCVPIYHDVRSVIIVMATEKLSSLQPLCAQVYQLVACTLDNSSYHFLPVMFPTVPYGIIHTCLLYTSDAADD